MIVFTTSSEMVIIVLIKLAPTLRPVLRTAKQDLAEERTLPADDQFANVMGAFAGLAGNPELHAAPRDMLVRQADLLAAVLEKAHIVHSRS